MQTAVHVDRVILRWLILTSSYYSENDLRITARKGKKNTIYYEKLMKSCSIQVNCDHDGHERLKYNRREES